MHPFHILKNQERYNWISCNRSIGRNWISNVTHVGSRILIICFFKLICLKGADAQTMHYDESIKILFLDHKKIDSILDTRENHLIFFWGTWCRPCYESLDTILSMDVNDLKIKFLLLAESHSSVKVLENVFRKYDLSKRSDIIFGLLHPKNYKKSYKRNIQIFNRFICQSCIEESKEDLRFSAVFIFDKDRRLLYYNSVLLSDEYDLIRDVIKSL